MSHSSISPAAEKMLPNEPNALMPKSVSPRTCRSDGRLAESELACALVAA